MAESSWNSDEQTWTFWRESRIERLNSKDGDFWSTCQCEAFCTCFSSELGKGVICYLLNTYAQGQDVASLLPLKCYRQRKTKMIKRLPTPFLGQVQKIRG